MKKLVLTISLFSLFLLLIVLQFNCKKNVQDNNTMSQNDPIARGKYLVNIGGCNDCHTPKMMTNMGPVPDTTKLLSGHPAGMPLQTVDTSVTNSKWIYTSMDLTTWVGPWGISYPANLTPDGPTGTGKWTEDVFIKAMRTGKHMGVGRPILPPMPWQSVAGLTDADLRAVFSYLKSLPPIKNQVPDPVPPNMVAQAGKMQK